MHECVHDAVKYSFPKYVPKGYHSLIQKLDCIFDSIAFVETKYLTWTKGSQVYSKTLQTSRMRVDCIVVAPLDHRLVESSSTLPLVYTSSISETCPCLGICWRFSSLSAIAYSLHFFSINFDFRIMCRSVLFSSSLFGSHNHFVDPLAVDRSLSIVDFLEHASLGAFSSCLIIFCLCPRHAFNSNQFIWFLKLQFFKPDQVLDFVLRALQFFVEWPGIPTW